MNRFAVQQSRYLPKDQTNAAQTKNSARPIGLYAIYNMSVGVARQPEIFAQTIDHFRLVNRLGITLS